MVTSTHDRLMPVDMMNWNPRGCIVSVIDDLAQARQAAADLREAGFSTADVRLAPAAEVIETHNTALRRGRLTRALRCIGSLGDEGVVAAEYLDEAMQGHQLLIVYAPKNDEKRRALAVVTGHRAHGVRYYGHWVITNNV
jgi:hypothetical protein